MALPVQSATGMGRGRALVKPFGHESCDSLCFVLLPTRGVAAAAAVAAPVGLISPKPAGSMLA
jgi:hypothetical protein